MTQEQKEKKGPEGIGLRGKEELVLKRERGTRQRERKHLEMAPLQEAARGLQELQGPQRTTTV